MSKTPLTLNINGRNHVISVEPRRTLADAIRVPFQRVNEIVTGRRGLSPSTALRLAKFFGTSAGFWLNLQMIYDLQQAEQKEAAVLKTIRKIKTTQTV